MKKLLLAMTVASIGLAPNAQAQLALEDFNGGSLPANWALINDGHTVSTNFAPGSGLQPRLTDSAWVSIDEVSLTDLSMITTSYFNPAATADRWILTPSFSVTNANMVIQWQDYDLNSGESMEVWVSPTAGITEPSYTQQIYSAPAGVGDLVTHQAMIGQYNGAGPIRVGFRDHTQNNWGVLLDNVQTTILPHSLDLSVTSLDLFPFVQVNSSNPITGVIHNNGGTTITSMRLNYSVNGGTPVSTNLTGLTFVGVSDYNYTSTAWVPSAGGNYTIKVWADNLNGAGNDEEPSNDTLIQSVIVADTLVPKMVMVEEFTQASCDPCAGAAPNVDSVYANNASRSILIRYHVNWPGVDYMDDVTLSPFVQSMISFYDVQGVPDAQVDGQYVDPGAGGPNSFSTGIIATAAALKSPLSINVTANYAAATHTYSFSADIKSFGPLPLGLVARAALAVDQITYTDNQSTESIPQYVFPEVAENMFPSASGTTLTAFTSGQTQTITATWVKNHPWGSLPATRKYDSSATGKIIVWVEDENEKYVYQAGYVAVPTGGVTGVNVVTGNNGAVDIYPNPASAIVNVSIQLNVDATVKMEVYNSVGEVVYTMPATQHQAGLSNSSFDVSNFANGNYFVKMYIGDELLTKKLTITK